MTVREKLVTMLEAHGLFADDANASVDRLVAQLAEERIEVKWADDVTAYPDALHAVLAVRAKYKAGEYLKANKPNHWAIRVLEGAA